jgi:DNA polymerase-3 subunit delta'
MLTETILPWQKNNWESLLARKKQNRLPHALLFSGMDGSGKKEFAEHFAQYLLCSQPLENGACGKCKACRLQQAKSHPDFLNITPEEDSQFIKIDQIREVVNRVNGTAMLNGSRVILIHPASAMNVNAANALLKTLEEPTADTYLILISAESSRLPATISSRCQKMMFSHPSRGDGLTWLRSHFNTSKMDELTSVLELAEGGPLRAREYLQNGTIELRRNLYDGLIQLQAETTDPVEFAQQWKDEDVKMILQLLLSFARDLLRYKLTESDNQLINSDYQDGIKKISIKFTQENIVNYSEMLQKMYAWVLNAMNMNRQLLLKEIFIRWVKVC